MNFIKEDDSTTVEIELRDLKSILDDVVIGDYAEFHAEEIAGGYAVAIDKFMSDRVLSKITEFNQKAFLNSSAKKPYKSIEISEEGLELIEFLSLDCTANGGEWHSDSEIKIDKNGYVIVDAIKPRSSGMVTYAAKRNLSDLKFVTFVGMKLFGRCNQWLKM